MNFTDEDINYPEWLVRGVDKVSGSEVSSTLFRPFCPTQFLASCASSGKYRVGRIKRSLCQI